MSNDLTYWRAALEGKRPEINADNPQAGYYRMREGRGGKYLPVVIWAKDGALAARVAGDMRAPLDIWTHCGGNAVSKEAAMHAFNTGEWPGDAPEIGQGHNSGDVSLAEQIKDYAAMAVGWLRKAGGIKDAVSKDKAANFRAKLIDLRKQADAEREAKKRPLLEAGRAVDAEFKPLIEEADAAANELREALTVFMRAEEEAERKRRAEEHKKEQERVAAERAKIEKERAEKLAKDPVAALTDPEPELPAEPPPPEPVKVRAGGQRGRATGLRTVTRYVVTNHEEALNFFKDSDDVRDLIQKLSERACKAGVAVPGVEKTEDRVAA